MGETAPHESRAEMELQHSKERQAIGIALARKRGVYTGRKSGTTKAAPSRARALKKQGLEVSEIVVALGVKQRSVYNYLSRRAACDRKKRYCTSKIV